MNTAAGTRGSAEAGEGPVLAVLEDCAAGAALIECSAALARAFGRELAVVHVQSTLALQAAALPQTLALAHAGAPWAPFAPEDVERGWRAQASRLQALAGPIALRHSLRWSLRTMRGEPVAVARELLQQTDLLVLGAAAWPSPTPRRAGLPVAVWDDGSPAGQRASAVCERLVPAPAGTPSLPRRAAPPTIQLAGEPALEALLQRPPHLAALVLPRSAATPARWARLRRLGCPVWLVG